MREELAELWRHRELLLTMVSRELRIRYKNSKLGILWSFLNPLVTVAVMTFVFGKFSNLGAVNSYSAYILAAYLPYTFFQFAILDSAQSILAAGGLIKKIAFPREVLPLAGILANFIHLLIGIGVFFAFLLIVFLRDPRVVPFQATTIYLPILLLISFAMAVGFGLLVAALNTFYEDVKYLANVGLYLLFFLTPVMYFQEQVANSAEMQANGGLLYKLYNLNPLTPLSTAYRKILLAPQKIPLADGRLADPLPLHWGWVGYSAAVSVVILVIGYATFNRLKPKFTERP